MSAPIVLVRVPAEFVPRDMPLRCGVRIERQLNTGTIITNVPRLRESAREFGIGLHCCGAHELGWNVVAVYLMYGDTHPLLARGWADRLGGAFVTRFLSQSLGDGECFFIPADSTEAWLREQMRETWDAAVAAPAAAER